MSQRKIHRYRLIFQRLKKLISNGKFHFRTSPYRSSPQQQTPRRRTSTVSINSRSGSYDGDASAARLSVDSETTSTSMMKRQKASQARATQMQALYELNCDKDLPLNTKANFKTASISLGQTMTAQQAIAAYKQTEKDFIEKAPDPLLQERERERVEREKANCKVQLIKREALVSGHSNYGIIPHNASHLKAQQRQIRQENAATAPPSRLKLASQTPMRVLDAMKLRHQGYKASGGTLC